MQRAKSRELRDNLRRGFTLIELLIVITIIGVLTTIVTANFIGIRERARDSQRKSDIVQIQQALEFFRTDMNRYPQSNEFPPTTATCDAQFVSGSSIYMKKTPCDPTLKTYYYYLPSGTNTSYTLYACLENNKDKDKNTTQNRPINGPACTSATYYVVTDP